MGKSLLNKITAQKPKRYKQQNPATQAVYSKRDGSKGKNA